jgi:hypothetical protein
MTAPDFIWAYNERQTGYGFVAKGPQTHFQGVEYVRRAPAVLAELPEVKALIAAAVDGAADNWVNVKADGGLAVAALIAYSERIRALTPADAKAALDRMLADARRDARNEARNEAAERFANHPAIQMRRYADTPKQWRWDVYRALIQEAPHG